MTIETPMRCSALSEQLAEPMIGSVDHRRRWLLVEDRSAWGTKAVRDVLGAELEATAKAAGLRPLLVRRREDDPAADAIRTVILVDTLDGIMASRRITDLGELSIHDAIDAPIAEFGEPMAGPLFLVCTNGKRDACCALRGRVLMSAMAARHGETTWECTHLGGHRFAGNLVCLPHGIVYGRVLPADGPRLADAYLDGRLDPDLMRGRSAWPEPAQVAAQALRRRTGLDGVADIGLREVEADGDAATVTLATPDGVAHRFELRAERLAPPRAVSCRADELEEPLHWALAR